MCPIHSFLPAQTRIEYAPQALTCFLLLSILHSIETFVSNMCDGQNMSNPLMHSACSSYHTTDEHKKKRRTSSKNCGRIFFDAFKYKTIFAIRIYRWLSFIQHSYAPCLGWQHSVHKASMWRDKSSGKGEKINEETFQFPQKYPFFLCSFIHSSARHIASLP